MCDIIFGGSELGLFNCHFLLVYSNVYNIPVSVYKEGIISVVKTDIDL